MKVMLTLLLSMTLALFHSPLILAGWELLPNSPTASGRHSDVFFISPVRGWIASPNGIHRTTDGGETWELQANIGTVKRSIGFVDSLHGWVGTITAFPNPALYSTSDGGFTWSPVQNFMGPPPESICGISVVNDSVIYASGAYYGFPRVIKTTNRGITWQSFNLDSLAGALVDCYFFNRDSGIVVGSTDSASTGNLWGNALVLTTVDGGNTWMTTYVGSRDEELCWKTSFLTPQVGFVSVENFAPPGPVYFLMTSDGGATWTEKMFLDSHYDEQGIGFVTDSLGWIGGWGGDTYETTDAGETWTLGGPGRVINRFRFLGDSLGYAVGDRVYKYTKGSTSTHVQLSDEPLVLDYELYQNFPNPSNPATTVNFFVPEKSLVRLSIVDLLGQEVSVLLNDVRPAGEHVVGWDGKNKFGEKASSGVYFYVMHVPSRILTGKLGLLQ